MLQLTKTSAAVMRILSSEARVRIALYLPSSSHQTFGFLVFGSNINRLKRLYKLAANLKTNKSPPVLLQRTAEGLGSARARSSLSISRFLSSGDTNF